MGLLRKIKQHQFLLEQLIERDFKKKYKRTLLGVGWSVLSPLLMILVLSSIFKGFFGRNVPHYLIYIFSGQAVFNYFSEATNEGMAALTGNASIFTKVNVPKFLFLISKNVSVAINFLVVLLVYFFFCIGDGLYPNALWLTLIYPVVFLTLFNVGLGLILSAMFVMFKDIQYLYRIFTQMLVYMSAIFYTVDHFDHQIQNLFFLNPVYAYIYYFRSVVISNILPSPEVHFICAGHAAAALIIGCIIYKKYNYRFLYYI